MNEHCKNSDGVDPSIVIKLQSNKGSENKLNWFAIPWESLIEVAKVFHRGAKPSKYGKPHTYRRGIFFSKLASPIIRHFWRWTMGEDKDEEGNYHLACIAANCLMLLSIKHLKHFDDRTLFDIQTFIEDDMDL